MQLKAISFERQRLFQVNEDVSIKHMPYFFLTEQLIRYGMIRSKLSWTTFKRWTIRIYY